MKKKKKKKKKIFKIFVFYNEQYEEVCLLSLN